MKKKLLIAIAALLAAMPISNSIVKTEALDVSGVLSGENFGGLYDGTETPHYAQTYTVTNNSNLITWMEAYENHINLGGWTVNIDSTIVSYVTLDNKMASFYFKDASDNDVVIDIQASNYPTYTITNRYASETIAEFDSSSFGDIVKYTLPSNVTTINSETGENGYDFTLTSIAGELTKEEVANSLITFSQPQLATVTDVSVTGSDGNYQVTFTDSNDASIIETYKITYYTAVDGSYTYAGYEYISGSGATLNYLSNLKSGYNNFLTVTPISNNDNYLEASESDIKQFVYYPAMYQSGVILENIVEFNNKPHEAYSGGVSGSIYHDENFDFTIFKKNILVDSTTSGYATSFNQWNYSLDYVTVKNHVYYVGFAYEYNEEVSTYFANETFCAELSIIKSASNEYADYQNRLIKFPQNDNKSERIGRNITAIESTSLAGISFELNEQISQNTGVNSLEVISVKDLVVLDLTEIYGAGKEPSAESITNFIENYGRIDHVELSTTAILGPQYLEASCNHHLYSSEILSYYKTLDGSAVYILDGNYTANADKAGTYYVTLAYKDSSNVVYKRMINVIVYDDVAPEINLVDGNVEITSYISSPLTSAEILSMVKATDNTDGNVKSAMSIDATNYLANQKIVGRYPIVLEVSDSAGNSTTKTIYINVVNDLGPVFDAPTVIYKSEEIVFNKNDVLNTIASVVDQDGNHLDLWADEGLNSDNFLIVQDTLTGNANKAGSYIIKVKAWDNEGRVAYHTFTIKVVEDIPNIVMYNNTIFVSFDTTLSNKNIKSILKKCGLTNKTDENAIITFPVNEYEDNNYAAGQSYDVKVRYVCANGTEENYNLVIKVLDTKTMAIEKTNWFERNWGWVVLGVVGVLAIGIVANIFGNKKTHRRR